MQGWSAWKSTNVPLSVWLIADYLVMMLNKVQCLMHMWQPMDYLGGLVV